MPVHAAKKAKNIAVVGAGPAGMAFAHTAASRGHKVTLFDAQNQIGGQLNIAKQIPGKPEFAETLRYFDQVLDDVGVVRVLGKKVAAADLQGFDEIVLASGIVPRQIGLPGSERAEVLSYLDVLRDKKPVGRRVAIIGAGGIGFDTAEYLSQHGEDSALSPDLFREEWQIDASMARRGALLSNEPQLPPSEREIWLLQRKEGMVGRNLGKTTGWIHRTVLKYKGVNMLGGVEYLKIDSDGLHIRRNGAEEILPVDNVVICAGQEPNRALQAECEALGKPVHIIGGADVAAELDAKRAIKAGTELGLAV